MIAVTAADASGFVEYFFECTTAGCADSGWQTSTSYVATGLAGASEYSFRVKARDAFGNENTWSNEARASTTNALPVANDDSAMTSTENTIVISVLDNDTDADGHTLTVISAGAAANGTVTFNNTSITYMPRNAYVGSDSFSYTVSDGVASDSATVTVLVEATPEPPQRPTDVTATASNNDGVVTISWSHSGSEVSRFEIVRQKKHKKRDAWNSTALVATVSASSPTTIDDRPDSGGTYRYLVRAVNGVGNAESDWAEVTVAGGGGGGSNPKCHPKRGCG
jgi:hypothetical protein